MGANRKLQIEIDRTLKKVAEGIEIFDQIWDKVSILHKVAYFVTVSAGSLEVGKFRSCRVVKAVLPIFVSLVSVCKPNAIPKQQEESCFTVVVRCYGTSNSYAGGAACCRCTMQSNCH